MGVKMATITKTKDISTIEYDLARNNEDIGVIS